MDEQFLIEKLRQGDEAAFREIVETWKNLVYNTALGILQNAEDAEDVTQEVFVQVFESIKTFKAESKLSTWLYRITVSKALDHLRRKKRKKRFAYIQSLFGAGGETLSKSRILITRVLRWIIKKGQQFYLKPLTGCLKTKKLHLPCIR